MVSKVRSNGAETVIQADLDMKCDFEDESLDSLNESAGPEKAAYFIG